MEFTVAVPSLRATDFYGSEVLKIQAEINQLLKAAGWDQTFAGDAATPRFYVSTCTTLMGRFFGLWARDFHLGAIDLFDPAIGSQEIVKNVLARVGKFKADFTWSLVENKKTGEVTAWPGDAQTNLRFLYDSLFIGEVKAQNRDSALRKWTAINKKAG